MKLQLENVNLRRQVRDLQPELKGAHFAERTQQLETQVSALVSQLQAANVDIRTKETELPHVREALSQREAEVLLFFSKIQSIPNKASERVTVKESEVLLGEGTQELAQPKDEF